MKVLMIVAVVCVAAAAILVALFLVACVREAGDMRKWKGYYYE